MRLVDTHSHIHDAEFDADRAATIDRARAAGVEVIVALGVTAANSAAALALARAHACIAAAAGVHPHDAAEATDADLRALDEMADDPAVALVGEIGLDFYRNLSPRDAQLRVLERQLRTAARVRKPVAVHAREAHGDMAPLLEAWSRSVRAQWPAGRPLGVMHYFSADADLALRYVEWGFLVSIHTSVTHPNAKHLQDVARRVPLEYLVLETDSPYGAPQTYRGKRNEPAFVAEAAHAVAELRGLTPDAVAAATTGNALRLLGREGAGARASTAAERSAG